MKKVLLAVVLFMAIAGSVYADCTCICVSNEMTWVCGNSWDVPAGWCGGWCSN